MEQLKYLHSASYRTGENRFHISEIEGYEGRLKSMGVPVSSKLGLGYICVSADIYGLLSDTIADTIQRSGIGAAAIDSVIVCSSHFADPFSYRNRRLASALSSNRISPQSLRGVCGMGCVDLICGIEVAAIMLDAGIAKNILMIGMESSPDLEPVSRLRNYALISDAVVSFVIGCSPGRSNGSRSYTLRASKSVTIISRIGTGMNMSDAKVYARNAVDSLASEGLHIRDATKVFGSNVFQVVKLARESYAGISESQMYLKNVERIGHCLSCDSIINLVDYDKDGRASKLVLLAEAEGHVGVVFLGGRA